MPDPSILYNVEWTFGDGYPELPASTTRENSGAHWVTDSTVGIQAPATTPGNAVDHAERIVSIPGVNLDLVPVAVRNA